MNKPLFAFGISLLVLGIGMLYGVSVVAQVAEISVEVTGRGGAYWVVMQDGNQVSQHTLEREAVQSAINAELADPNLETTIVHQASIDVEAYINIVMPDSDTGELVVDPVIEPVVEPAPISIPGGGNWIAIPDNMTVQGFRQINDAWIAGGPSWLYLFKVGQDTATGFLLRNPGNDGSGELTEAQIAEVLAAIIESDS